MKLKHLLFAFGLMAVCNSSFADDKSTTKTPVNGYPDFALGADLSWTSRIENDNLYTYYRGNVVNSSEITNIASMASDYGLDAVRLRVWVNPSNDVAKTGFSFKVSGTTYESIGTQGYSSVDDLVSLAKRFAAQGQRIMVSFQLSDTWADPARQFIPAAWADCTTTDQLKQKVVDHITEVLTLLHDANVNVAWVQIGNETNTGMLKYQLPSSTSSTTTVSSVSYGCEVGNNSQTTTNFVNVFKAAAEAAKAVYPETKTVLHLTKAAVWSTFNWSLNLLVKAGLNSEMCDLIGLSLYPGIDDSRDSYTADWKKYADYGLTTINNIYSKYGFRTILCEIGMNNEYSYSTNVSGLSDSDVQAAHIAQCNKDIRAYTQYLIDNLNTSSSTCEGLFYWEPEGDYLDSYSKGACVSITPDANWTRDKVTANDFWKVCQENSTFPAGGLKEYSLNANAEVDPLYIVGDFNSWNYTSPAQFDYDSATGLYSFTADCTGSNGLWLSISTDKSSETAFKAAQYAPISTPTNGVTVNYSKSSNGFAVPYSAQWQITINPARGTINLYTTDANGSSNYETLYYYVYDKTGAADSKTALSTTDGVIYSATGNTFPNQSTNLDFCITNEEWTSVWRSPSGQWNEVPYGEEIEMTKGGPNNNWIWGWTLASTDYVWFNATTGHLLISASSECPWESTSTGTEYTFSYDNSSTQWNAVYAYILDADGKQLTGAWPGIRMDADGGNIYKCVLTLTTTPVSISFSDGLNRSTTYDFENGKQYAYTSSIKVINTNDDNAKTVYYNLEGVRLNRPMQGVNIVKKGNTVKKIIVRNN